MVRTTRASAARATEDISATVQQLSSPPSTPVAKGKKAPPRSPAAPKANESRSREPKPPANKRKRAAAAVKEEEDPNQLPHNLGSLPTPRDDASQAPPAKRSRRTKVEVKDETVKDEVIEAPAIKNEGGEDALTPKRSTKKSKNYGVIPGSTPYPDYPRPTPEECQEVTRLLEKEHGKVIAPKAIPPPSLDVAGCGEVPSVLDALIRTRLSAATTGKNSSSAFQGIVKRFGLLEEGIGKGSVDWDAVRLAPQKELFEAIKCGGLANNKSKDIKEILQMVYEENQARKEALTNPSDDPKGAEIEADGEKQAEIAKAKQNVISLDHLHLLSTPDAIAKMTTYPGIGPKTASCVALFCLQRPSFAVDTHVFRLCQYLGWIPPTTKKGQPKVGRETAYAHCDVRVPDELKYPLHQLMIKHGKQCPRCRAATGTGSANWEEGCPIEHLVKRHGAKKGGTSVAARKKSKAAAEADSDEEEDFELEGDDEVDDAGGDEDTEN